MGELIFVERVRKDEFSYLISLPDKNGQEHDLEVKIVFADGKLSEVQPPFAVKASDTDLAEYWQMQGQIAQMIENAKRRLDDENLPLVSLGGDSLSIAAATSEIIDREEMEDFPSRSSHAKKLTAETVIKLRKQFKDPRHKDLQLNALGETYGVTGTSISNAVLGLTWKSVDKKEPPVPVGIYENTLLRPAPERRTRK